MARMARHPMDIALAVLVLYLGCFDGLLFAQINFSNRSVGGGVAGSAAARSGQSAGMGLSTAGLQQTGQIQARGAIQRTDTGFVGATSQSMVDLSALRGGGGGSTNLPTSGLGNLGALGRGGLGAQLTLGLGRAGLGQFGGLGQIGQLNQMNLAGQQGRTQQQQMRVAVRIGFEPVRTAPTTAANRFVSRLARIPALQGLNDIQVSVEGRSVVLRGTVPTEHDRELLARLALLEPGIDAVQNELRVQTPTP